MHCSVHHTTVGHGALYLNI